MTRVAKQFGLSDVAMHKICRKHDIPTPPQGYWAKKEFGKPVSVTPLPTGSNGPIYIHERAAGIESSAVSEARALVHAALTVSPDVPALISPILERSLGRLDGSKPGKDGLVRVKGDNVVMIAIRPDSTARAKVLLTSLVEAAAKAGVTLVAAPGGARWLAEGEQVAFEFREVPDKLQHHPSEKEIRALERWEAERAVYLKRTGFDYTWGKPHIPKWEERFQGRLAFVLEAVRHRTSLERGAPSRRSTFSDTKTRDLAKAIPQVVAEIAAIAVIKRENTAVDEARQRSRAEAEQRRLTAERVAARERAQEAGLSLLLSGYAKRRELAEWLADLAKRSSGAPLPPRVARLQAWATERLVREEEAAMPLTIERWLADQMLFTPDDDQTL